MSSVEIYQQALRDYHLARSKMATVAEAIEPFARLFRDWLGVDAPCFTGELRSRISAWPTADRLSETLSEWNDAWDKVVLSWCAIPENDRIGLTAPEKKWW